MSTLPPSESSSSSSSSNGSSRRSLRTTQVIVVGSVMFTFISYWRTAAVVLCDLASSAYYIGGIVEQSIGPAAPWFILAVMLFSYAVRSVYIESCSLFVRGGVYRVVKEAMGGFLGKLSVSALMFDYILTGPISGVSAGQYLIGLLLETLKYFRPEMAVDEETAKSIKAWGSAGIAAAITVYFFYQNRIGIHESSEKAFKIMIATTVMAAIILTWCGVTLVVQGRAPQKIDQPDGPRNVVPIRPDFHPKMNYDTNKEEDPLGFISKTGVGEGLRGLNGGNWMSLIGLVGIMLAFGHSILAMSGEETLAQVYREVESPKLPNFRKAAFIVFIYSLVLTGGISFLAVLLIPDDVRMKDYAGNLIGGLAMNVWGPTWWRLILNALVTVVGFLILAGAVNTAIIGSNGVLNRVAEDGVLPDWLLKPHPRYGTTYRVLWLILILQLFTIAISGGDTLILGEAYAFGVVWSFVFKAMSMVVLRFRDHSPRAYRVPFNIKIAGIEIPLGLIAIFVVLLFAAVLNLVTKDVATVAGLIFTAAFLTVFVISEQVNLRKHPGAHGHHEHLEQFNVKTTEAITCDSLGLTLPYTKLVAIRSPHNLFMLEKTLAETDPETTNVVVMTAKIVPDDGAVVQPHDLDNYDQHLMTAVVERAEKAGKRVKPLIVPTNNALHAVLRMGAELNAQEIVLGASNKYAADEQLDQIALYWMTLQPAEPKPVTIRLLSRDRDVHLDIAGGNRIPRISERQARNVAELRAAGVGVGRVLMLHDGTPACSDLFQSVVTMLDPLVTLSLAQVPATNGSAVLLQKDHERASKLGREVSIHPLPADFGQELVELAREGPYDLIVLPGPGERGNKPTLPLDGPSDYVLRHAHCPVFMAVPPVIPAEAVKD